MPPKILGQALVRLEYNSDSGNIFANIKLHDDPDNVLENFLNIEIHGPDGYKLDDCVAYFWKALYDKQKQSFHLTRLWAASLDIDENKATLTQRKQELPSKKYIYEAYDLLELIYWWGGLRQELRWHTKFNQPWNNIPTVLDKDGSPETIYWDPIAKAIITDKERLAEFGVQKQ